MCLILSYISKTGIKESQLLLLNKLLCLRLKGSKKARRSYWSVNIIRLGLTGSTLLFLLIASAFKKCWPNQQAGKINGLLGIMSPWVANSLLPTKQRICRYKNSLVKPWAYWRQQKKSHCCSISYNMSLLWQCRKEFVVWLINLTIWSCYADLHVDLGATWLFANSLLLSHSEKTMKSYSEIHNVRKTYRGYCSVSSFEIVLVSWWST